MRGAAVLGVVALLAAGCGGTASRVRPPHSPPRLPHALAGRWRAEAEAVAAALAAGDGCLALRRAVALRTSVIAALNAHRVAPRLQEPLVGGVNDLAARIACTPPPAEGEGRGTSPAHAHGRGHGHGHGHGHGKHG
jgi:hypothetical protein